MESAHGTSEMSESTLLPARDETAALAATGGDEGLAQELFETLLEVLPKELSAINVCYEAQDWQGVADAAHHARGATSYCGVPALDAALTDLERAARKAETGRLAIFFDAVTDEAKRLGRLRRSVSGS